MVIEHGARHLTLESVAERAKISRGGLLYHFPSKEALLIGMLESQRNLIVESREKKLTVLPAGPGREAAAYVQTFLDEDRGKNIMLTAAIIASAAHNPELLSSTREGYAQTLSEITRKGLRFERAAVITLATQGLRLMEALNVSPFSPENRKKIVNELMALAKIKEAKSPKQG